MAEASSNPPKTPRKRAAPATAANIAVAKKPKASNGASSKSTFDKVKDQASTLASEATDAARKAATSGKARAAGALDGVAKLAEDAAQTVEDRLGPAYANYARKAASGVSGFASSLQSKDIDELIADTKAFVRKSPAIAIGTAAAVGFLLTRLIKVGSSDDKA